MPVHVHAKYVITGMKDVMESVLRTLVGKMITTISKKRHDLNVMDTLITTLNHSGVSTGKTKG